MSKALTLSIVIPVYNEESYIGTCLDAIANQTRLPDEVLVVDNNSTDKTVSIASSYPFVTIIHETRQSVMYAHKTGMNAATGDIIGRIDADTILDEHWSEEVVRSFADQNIRAVVGPNGHHDFVFPKTGRWLEDKLLKGALRLGYDFLFGCNMAIRRSTWEHFEPELCEDKDIFEDMDLVAHMAAQNVAPTYNPNMTVMISARRVGDSPRAFLRYIHGHVRTARKHNASLIGAFYAEIWFTFFYAMAKPLHMCFDPVTRRPSLQKFIIPSEARPNPLGSESSS